MKNKILYFSLLVITGLLSLPALGQQDPRFSLYMFDKTAINPAAAGSKDALEANLIARNQWLDISGAPKTAALLVEAPVASKKIGWGAEVINDQIGPTTSTAVQGDYSYHIPLFSGQLSAGISAGIYNYVIDFSKINYKDQSDPYNAYNRSQKIVPTAAAGLYYYSHSFYIGLSANHLIKSRLTNESYDSAASFWPHAYFIVGQGITLSPNLLFNPSLTIDAARNAPLAGDINLNFLLQEKLWLGLSFRARYGFGFMAAYRISPMFQLGYAYELGLNGIGQAGGGTHEISLTADFGKNKTIQASPRYF